MDSSKVVIPERETERGTVTEHVKKTMSATGNATENETLLTTGKVQEHLEDTENVPGVRRKTGSVHESDTEITETGTANLGDFD